MRQLLVVHKDSNEPASREAIANALIQLDMWVECFQMTASWKCISEGVIYLATVPGSAHRVSFTMTIREGEVGVHESGYHRYAMNILNRLGFKVEEGVRS